MGAFAHELFSTADGPHAVTTANGEQSLFDRDATSAGTRGSRGMCQLQLKGLCGLALVLVLGQGSGCTDDRPRGQWMEVGRSGSMLSFWFFGPDGAESLNARVHVDAGRIQRLRFYDKGKSVGLYQSWHANGERAVVGEFREGAVWRFYSPDGKELCTTVLDHSVGINYEYQCHVNGHIGTLEDLRRVSPDVPEGAVDDPRSIPVPQF
jgi:hypothetical protein